MKKNYSLASSLAALALLLGSCQSRDVSSLELGSDPVLLTLATNQIESNKGQAISTEVYCWSSQGSVTASSNQDWCEVSVGDSGIVIEVPQNPSLEEYRAATITVVASSEKESKSSYISIYQAAFEQVAAPGVYLEEYGGVIFNVSDDLDSCLLVSPLVPAINDKGVTGVAVWSTEQIVTGATNEDYGESNMISVKAATNYSEAVYPAFYFCDNLEPAGTWFLPAYEEMLLLFDYDVMTAVNETFIELGIPELERLTNSENHWTSTENGAEKAYVVKNSAVVPSSSSYAKTGSSSNGGRWIRAVKKIPIPEALMP